MKKNLVKTYQVFLSNGNYYIVKAISQTIANQIAQTQALRDGLPAKVSSSHEIKNS